MIIIERLDRDKHNRIGFSCGKDTLDRFLHEHAHQAFRKNLAITYVAVKADEPARILGYHSICNFQIQASDLPRTVLRKYGLPPHTIPSTLLARLAVSLTEQGRGIGELLLFDALKRCFRAGLEIASVAVVVDALEESIVPFYERYGFIRSSPDSLKLFIMMDTLARIPEIQTQISFLLGEAV